MHARPRLALAALVALAACDMAPPSGREADVTRLFQEAPEGAAAGTCWGRMTTPAVFETVTEQILVQPATWNTDGTPASPPIYRTETRQSILRERVDSWFERPCDAVMTEEFVASLQRALAARGAYVGPITGMMDARTQAAVRAFQREDGIDSGMISLAAARRLGLVAVPRDQG